MINEKPEITKLEPALYIVPTPIGNLEDITLRALKILASADVIACEDTRHSGNLLKQYNITYKKLESYHEHNEIEKAKYLVQMIQNGKSVAVITDAGTPGISDPAYRIVCEAAAKDIKIISLPGPSAMITALVASGLPTDKFIFYGFPPQKKGRKTFLQKVLSLDSTVILYESPYRIIKLLEEIIASGFGESRICIAREISKIHEEYIRGTVTECYEICKEHKNLKGEFVVMLSTDKLL